ncbi:MAG: iron chelate uptake ABC transporter family permease subunit, partial [Candidatus Omnitrophica bacterium]|nr:iron chelate uptake ABC transporter family permease subunit [Candidatus Omnitrophota bacterium]MBD3268805.1 iron chelate uptake ABC transporter family permease subunit [Candidatus Omnitrophota bacterium]
MIEALQFEFVQNALIAAILVSIACGVIGSYVIVKRIVFISGGIAHAAFGGIGLGYYLGINPVLGVIPFSLFSALGIGILSRKSKLSEDTAIGIFWAMGMSVGVILIGLSPGYAPDLFSYLFGNILTVPSSDIILMGILDLIIILTVLLFFKEFLAISFDEEFSRICGLKVEAFYFLLLSLIALTVVMLVSVVGIILVIALLTIPASIARQYTDSLKIMMFLAIIIGIFLTVCGLIFSYLLDIASGPAIIL